MVLLLDTGGSYLQRNEVQFSSSCCYGLFVFPQNQYVDILTPKVDDMKRWGLLRHLGHEGRDFMNVISAM